MNEQKRLQEAKRLLQAMRDFGSTFEELKNFVAAMEAEATATWEPEWGSVPSDAVAVVVGGDREIMYLENAPIDGRWCFYGSGEHVPEYEMGNWEEMFFVRPEESEIDWSQIEPEYNWVVKYSGGDVFKCTKEPHRNDAVEWFSGGYINPVDKELLSPEYLALPWRESLRQRPESV